MKIFRTKGNGKLTGVAVAEVAAYQVDFDAIPGRVGTHTVSVTLKSGAVATGQMTTAQVVEFERAIGATGATPASTPGEGD